ncbi:hypothetical protein [Actinoplanes sp. G11-F43]|uniref:hypothetical protein n=1 Tax=Actinoplanes sp. G11-F43 TaxID=3424130 RepID=UPI003D335BEE
MTVFGCGACGAALSVPVSPVTLPEHASHRSSYGPGSHDPVLEPRTYAVDPLPCGPPFRRWDQLAGGEAEALGWYAPRSGISGGPAGRVLLTPGDVRGMVIDPARDGDGGCCGLAGYQLNTVCAACGTAVAAWADDCGYPREVWLDPRATRVIDDGPGPHPPLSWTDLAEHRPGIPPAEPEGYWNHVWTVAAGAATAHLLAVSGGARIRIPDPLTAAIFRPVLDRLAGSGPERTLTLAGPGRAAADGDFALVPVHPQTGEIWPVDPPVKPVPLAWDVWSHLAYHRDPRPAGRSVPLPPEAKAELLPGLFFPDDPTFFRVLARRPEVRQPWLRAVYDRSRHDYRYFDFDR